MTKKWVCVGANENIRYGLQSVTVGNQKIIIGVLDGEMFAFGAFCPHRSGPMECSEVEGAIVTCPLHGWRFDLRQGGREIHGYRGLSTLNVKVEKGQVFVELVLPAAETVLPTHKPETEKEAK